VLPSVLYSIGGTLPAESTPHPTSVILHVDRARFSL